jgi:hypothetical protein
MPKVFKAYMTDTPRKKIIPAKPKACAVHPFQRRGLSLAIAAWRDGRTSPASMVLGIAL